MSKHIRKTEPQDTLVVLLVSYAELEPFLVQHSLEVDFGSLKKLSHIGIVK